YAVNDPNFPEERSEQPKLSTLAPECSKRVLDLMAQATATQKRQFQRWTDWSEPSAPTSLPSLEDYFAGPVEPSTTNIWKVAGKNVAYEKAPPTAKIVTSQYDEAYATRIPMRLDVTEGSVLSHKAEFADVVDQINMEVKKLPDAELISSTTIIDLDGGSSLSITKELTAPGLMLLYDQDGELVVTDDIQDQEFYRIYSYAEERGE
ncbi:MAG: hypothetical protein MI861_28205, partial [Pirellulales bacterium]|nr:hypothetical protein [Pirellulales bacterium]